MLNAKELAAINAIFHEYPARVAQIASWILDQTPNYVDDNYGFKVNITKLYEMEEKTEENNLRNLPWALLSSEDDVRHVCDFVARHIDDGTFERQCSPRRWRSLIDGTIHVDVDPIDKPFKDYTKIERYPYTPITAFRYEDHYLSEKEVAEINEIFHGYPAKIANIARFILEKSPLDEDTDYGFVTDIEALFKKENEVGTTKDLCWHELSDAKEVKQVCDFVLKHIADGTFEVKKESLSTKERADFDKPFDDLKEIASFSYDVTGGST